MSNKELAKSQKIDARIVQTVRSLRQSSNMRKPNTSSMQSKPQIRNEIRHPGTANTKIYIDVNDHNPYDDYSTMTRPNTDKDYYVMKESLNETMICGYKSYCQSLIQKDKEVHELWRNIRNKYQNNIELFLDNQLFNQNRFLYKLEVFHCNKSSNKEDFFKKEIMRVMENIYLDSQFNNKYKEITSEIENYYKEIENFSY